MLYLLAALAAFYLGSFTYMSISSRKVRQNGLVNGLLRFCPGTPNCVVSENSDKESYIEPFAYSGNPASAWERARIGIIDLGGRIENDTGGYLWSTFRSRFWHFVDDLELRMDFKHMVIHVRSASRVGKGDLGVNRKRVEELRSLFNRPQS